MEMSNQRLTRYRCQLLDGVQLGTIALVGLAIAPTLGGALSLSSRLGLQSSEYVHAQRLDHSALLVGTLGVLALFAVALHSFLVRGNAAAFAWSLVAVAGLAAAQVVFWAVAFPVIALTESWTIVPEDFESLRHQWEYALATAGVLSFGSLLAVVRAIEASRPIASLAILASIERDAAVRAARDRALALDGDKRQLERNVAA
jgi:hypothetical protein